MVWKASFSSTARARAEFARTSQADLDRYRLRWNNVKYEPGEIRVVTYNQYGDKVGEDVKRTAGEPAQMKFSVETPDHEPIACMVEGCTDEHNVLLNADGNDLAFITVSLLDKDGNECPLADDELTFEVTGAGTFKAACNGDATSLEPFTQPQMKLFSGKLVVIVQSKQAEGRHHPEGKRQQAQYRKVDYAPGNIRCSGFASSEVKEVKGVIAPYGR